MNEELIEEIAGAYRPERTSGDRTSPAWHDASPDERAAAFDLASSLRRLESALDPEGLSTSARAVLERIKSAVQ